MQAYSKLIAVVVGLIVLVGQKYLHIDLSDSTQQITDVVIALVTAYGVYQAPNKPKGES